MEPAAFYETWEEYWVVRRFVIEIIYALSYSLC